MTRDLLQTRETASILDTLGMCLCELTGTGSSDSGAVDFNLSHLWSAYSQLKQRNASQELRLAFLACTKSGKSTLINALVGTELLPVNNVPETAHICSIVHDLTAVEPFLVEPVAGALQRNSQDSRRASGQQGAFQPTSPCPMASQNITRGEAAVRARLAELNQTARRATGRRTASCCLPRNPSQPAGLGTALSLLPNPGRLTALGSPPTSPTPPADSPAPASATYSRKQSFGPSTVQSAASMPAAPYGGAGGWGRFSVDTAMTSGLAGVGSDLGAGGLYSPAPPGAMPPERVLLIHACVAALAAYGVGEVPQAGVRHGGAAQAAAAAAAAAAGRVVQLQLVDTPGSNEAGEDGLRWQVERLLDGVDACVYLLDYTKLKTQDEASIFQRLKQVNPALVRRLSQRFFFVVNKVDAAQMSEGQDLETTRSYVAELVTEQMGIEGFQLTPSQVVLVSARNALLSRRVLRGNASPEVRAKFVTLAFGRFTNPALITEDAMQAAAHALLAESGLPDLESQILAYLYTHAAGVKQLALADDMDRLLAEVYNVSLTCSAALSASSDALVQRSAELQAELAATNAAFDTVAQQADAVVEAVVGEVRTHLKALRGRLFGHIIATLDLSNQGQGQGQSQGQHLTGGWLTVHQRFLSIFTSLNSKGPFGGPTSATPDASPSPPAAAAAAAAKPEVSAHWGNGVSKGDPVAGAGVPDDAAVLAAAGAAVARTRSKQELVLLLSALHEAIMGQIHREVREFWGVMESVAAARHQELVQALNAHLQELSHKVEAVVSRSLAVQLSRVSLVLAPPDAAAFHSNLDQLLARGMVESREHHIRVGQKQVLERVLRKGAGLLWWGDRWESVPRTRTVEEAYNTLVYELAPAEVSRHFITMVDEAVDATQASLAAYVAEHVAGQLEGARQQLTLYGRSYQAAMDRALKASSQGAEQRQYALNQVQEVVTKVEGLRTALAKLQAEVEASVPRARAPRTLNDVEEQGETPRCSMDEERLPRYSLDEDRLPRYSLSDPDYRSWGQRGSGAQARVQRRAAVGWGGEEEPQLGEELGLEERLELGLRHLMGLELDLDKDLGVLGLHEAQQEEVAEAPGQQEPGAKGLLGKGQAELLNGVSDQADQVQQQDQRSGVRAQAPTPFAAAATLVQARCDNGRSNSPAAEPAGEEVEEGEGEGEGEVASRWALLAAGSGKEDGGGWVNEQGTSGSPAQLPLSAATAPADSALPRMEMETSSISGSNSAHPSATYLPPATSLFSAVFGPRKSMACAPAGSGGEEGRGTAVAARVAKEVTAEVTRAAAAVAAAAVAAAAVVAAAVVAAVAAAALAAVVSAA
ncbi:hypothetical protein V8C86DRAFT_3139812 [Haematococcus lacustris]